MISVFSESSLANPFKSTDKTRLSNQLIEYLRREHDKSSIDYLEPLTSIEKGEGGSLLSFKLKNPPPKLTNKLILRFSNAVPLEGTIQKQLKTQNYPVPTIHHLCTDQKIMGGPFLIREYVKGDVLWQEPSNKIKARHMAFNQKILHSINPKPIIKVLDEENINKISYMDSLQIEHFILEKELIGFQLPSGWKLGKDISWLEPGGQWIRDNKPRRRKNVVCHSDFHPFNIIMNSGRVEAVIDWQLCRVNELEFDIASTLHILLMVWPFSGIDVDVCTDLVDNYLEMYRETIDINEDRLNYNLGVRCLLGFCGMELGFEVFTDPKIYVKQVKKFEEIYSRVVK